MSAPTVGGAHAAPPALRAETRHSGLSIGEIVAVREACAVAIFAFVNVMNQARMDRAGSDLLDEQVQRLDQLRGDLLDKLQQRQPASVWEAGLRRGVLTNAVIEAEDWPEVARLAASAVGAY